MADLIITNGTIVSATGRTTGDVVVDLILTEQERDQFVVTFGEPQDAEWVQFNVLSRQ